MALPKTHTKAVNAIKEHATKFDLVDAWRISNPDILRYTWRRRKPEIHCRLDFFLVSHSLMCSVTHTDISAGFKTDHSLLSDDSNCTSLESKGTRLLETKHIFSIRDGIHKSN